MDTKFLPHFLAVALLAGMSAAQAGTISLNGTIRDFCAPDIIDDATSTTICTRLSDFEGAITGKVTGMVSNTLNAQGLPDYVGGGIGATNASNFAKWYQDVPGFNQSQAYTLTLNETGTGTGVYSYSNSDFFPIDGQLFGNQGRNHNYHFTLHLEGQASFTASDLFSFTGDDDLWVYLNNTLIMDLGGVHAAESDTISGADLINNYGLAADTLYDIDIFFAERHTVASNFHITTGFNITPKMPTPATSLLLGIGMVALGWAKRHNKTAA
jgi:fibro-slime domain-containing protein